MKRHVVGLTLLSLLTFSLSGCQDPLTAKEALEAVDELAVSSQALTLTSNSVEISTSFTIGQAVEAAANEIRDFVTSQLPCAEVTVSGGTLSIEYGVNPGNCTHNGQTFSGKHTITVSSTEPGKLVVDHSWDKFKNETVQVSGTAQVTWDGNNPSRRVVHELTWTRLRDGKTGTGSGDRTQKPLSGGILEGIQVDGNRQWSGESGEWNLDIRSVQMRWIDPIPQSGSYTLDTPFDKSVTLSFRRVDEDTIEVTVEGPRRSFSFNVNKLGTISEN